MRMPHALLLTTTLAAYAAPAAAQERSDWLDIEKGKSIVLELPQVPRAISLTDSIVADIVQLGSPMRWQVQGKQIGTTDLVIQFAGDVPPMIYEVTVHKDLSDLVRRIDALVEGEPPRVYPLNDRIVCEGVVDSLDTLERVAMLAQSYDNEFINLMRVRGDHQVQLEVIFAEVSRTQTREMGFNVLWMPSQYGGQLSLGNKFPTQERTTTGALFTYKPTPSNFTLGFDVLQGINLFSRLEILDEHGLAKVIAQPTLTALSGQQAELLSGGQIAYGQPNAQGAVQIKFKTFGTRMLFVPTVLGDGVIDVQVDLELSQVDPSVGTQVNGIEVPGLTTRWVKSHVRLRSGMTFAIAGLLSEKIRSVRDEVPGLGRIPILGMFFRHQVHEREEYELMVYVTPRIVRPLAPGELPPILGTTENNNPSDLALFLLGADRRAKSRTAEPTGDVGLQR
ncbi:MAG TPA: pilus assembly protein N-terminal domain-containing protein [Myxococcota bacterium]|nr:pilus assembly protein N-terminal domain-containing protein [Myxococcota bacterium]